MRHASVVCAVLLCLIPPLAAMPAGGQSPAGGTIRGTVTIRDDRSGLSSVTVTVVGTPLVATSRLDGAFTIARVPTGRQTLELRRLGFAPTRAVIDVTEGETARVDVFMDAQAIRLADVIISTPSRTPERIVDAPAAVTVVPPATLAALAPLAQAPLVLSSVPGVDLTQSGMTDFNVNARGFNSSLTRRVLVLQDGRDPAIAFLGAQEWSATGTTTDDVSRIEMVRGPGSALYGANAFSGVLSLTSTAAREAVGSRVSISTGNLETRRVSVRHAGLVGERFGYKVSGAYGSSDTWALSRTRRDSSDMVNEYQPATDSVVRKSREARPLNGQILDSTTLAAVGDRDPISSSYGALRLDYYSKADAVGTIEGGLADVRNETFVTGLGRVQVSHARRPWGRAAWAAQRLNLLAWYTGRDTREPQWSLGSGTAFLEKSSVLHGEVQYNNDLPGSRGRWIVGASSRQTRMNTSQTLVAPENDDRTDYLYSTYGQVEFDLPARLKLVAAGRWDDSDLFPSQWSPKAALVFGIDESHSLRFSVNRAFQAPSYAELFLSANAGAPTASPRNLELALNGFFATGRSIGTQGLPTALPWNFEAQTRVMALGNSSLDVEKIMSYEIGYKSGLRRDGYLTLDLYWNDTRDFVTDLLPNVNPAYPQYRYDDANTDVPAYLNAIIAQATALPAGAISDAQRQQIIAGAQALRQNYDALVAATQPLLATVNGQRALVVSYTNAGRVTERGVELGVALPLARVLRFEGSYALFDFDVREASAGTDALLPNTAKHKGTAGLTWQAGSRTAVGASLRVVSGYSWAAGVYNGPVPAAQTLNGNVAYTVTRGLKAFMTGTNLLDERRFQIYGGSLIRRRVVGGVTATF
jgi:outer membrane receptor for ferrienterochelin and colicins